MSTRLLAVRALSDILTDIKGSSGKPKEVLQGLSSGLDERERSFLMELVYGVIRYRDYLDWILGKFLEKPLSLPADTMNNLRMAIYQMRFMRVPDWAAVNEAVNIEKGRKDRKGNAGLVNAVLRNYLRRGKDIQAPDNKDEAANIAIMTSHPYWLVRRWMERLGRADARRLAEANNEIPTLTIRIDGDRDDAVKILGEHGIEAYVANSSPVGVIIKGSRKKADVGMPSGKERRATPSQIPLNVSSYVIQDEAAQLIAYLLDPAPGDKVLDACAAPGGKTTHMARLMNDEGEIAAVEVDRKRLKRLQENVSRLGLKSVKLVHGDMKKGLGGRTFDKILVDAPCSSIGVIRRNPDVKYRHEEKDLARFSSVQAGLIECAAGLLKPGGSMVYSVCSTEPEEGEDVIKSFLQSHPDFSIIQGAYSFLDRFLYRDESGHIFYRTWPHKKEAYSIDGFFAARLVREK